MAVEPTREMDRELDQSVARTCASLFDWLKHVRDAGLPSYAVEWWSPARRQPTPTEAMPGSADKIEVMRQRVANGEPVFADGDRNCYLRLDK